MDKTPTLLLDRSTIAELMRPADYLAAVERGLIAGHCGTGHSPPPLHIPVPGGGFHAKGALLAEGRSVVALKLNGNFPGNPDRTGLPTIQGAVLLCDADNGRLLAILDSIEITLRRTAAASALAARHLARSDARTLAVIGCGGQAAAQIEAICDVLPIATIKVWDRDSARAEALSASCDRPCQAVTTLEQAVAAADIVVTCTTATTPFLRPEHLAPGAFIAAVGADSAAKCELDPTLMAAGQVVVDSLDQCLHMGDLRHAVAAGAMRADAVHGELGAVLAGERSGRRENSETWIFDSTGTALQDVASAAAIYERALANGAGREVALS